MVAKLIFVAENDTCLFCSWFRNNEVQFAGQLQPQGCGFTLKVPAGDSKVTILVKQLACGSFIKVDRWKSTRFEYVDISKLSTSRPKLLRFWCWKEFNNQYVNLTLLLGLVYVRM